MRRIPRASRLPEGYHVVDDELPTRVDLRADDDRRVDLHPLVFDTDGNGLQQLQDGSFGTYSADGLRGEGRIAGRSVCFLTPNLQMRFHCGYTPDDNDRHEIRRIVEHLRDRDYAAPLRELRFAVSGGRIYFQHPDGLWAGDQAPDQVVLYQVLDVEAIKARIRRSVRPSREHEAGHVERRRGVRGSKAVFAGTRVPVAAVDYLERNLPDERILEAFPELTREDVEAARQSRASA